jgi:hypothetical protein
MEQACSFISTPPIRFNGEMLWYGAHLTHGNLERNFPRNEVNQGAQKYKKIKKNETVLSPSSSFDCEFGRAGEGEGRGRLEAYRMTDEEAARGTGRTEASSILVAMHHGM